MIDALSSHLQEIVLFISGYGGFWIYSIVFVSAIIENLFPPYPGDTVLFAGTVLAAAGRVEWPLVLSAGIVGNIAGALLVYWFGFAKGRRYFMRHRGKWISEANLHRIEGWFRLHGARLILISRFLTGIRSAVALTAGIGEVPVAKMAIYTAISTLLWNGLIVALALAFRHNWETIHEFAMLYNKIVLAIFAFVAVAWGAYRFWRARRRPNGADLTGGKR